MSSSFANSVVLMFLLRIRFLNPFFLISKSYTDISVCDKLVNVIKNLLRFVCLLKLFFSCNSAFIGLW